METLNFLLSLGPTILLPIIIFTFGIIMKAGVGRSFKSGVTIGIGFTGINLVINLLISSLTPAAQGMTENLGLNLTIIDIGWPAMASISWAWVAAGLCIPIIILINFVMLTLKLTKTMNIDIWNFWQFTFIGAAVSVVTDSVPIGIAAACIASIIALLLADYTQPYIENYFKIPGVSLPHLTALGFMPIVLPLNWLLDKIPGINKINVNPDMIRQKLGIIGDPISLGLIIGMGLGILGGGDIREVLNIGMSMTAVMYLMPKMVSILMEGLIPISEAARDFMTEKFKGREIFIGLDAAVALGDPSVVAVGLLLVPITIFIAAVLPGNQLFPFADLAVVPFIVCLITALSNGNIFRSLIISSIIMALVLLIGTNQAPIVTILAGESGVQMPDGATLVSNLDRSNLITWLMIKISGLF